MCGRVRPYWFIERSCDASLASFGFCRTVSAVGGRYPRVSAVGGRYPRVSAVGGRYPPSIRRWGAVPPEFTPLGGGTPVLLVSADLRFLVRRFGARWRCLDGLR